MDKETIRRINSRTSLEITEEGFVVINQRNIVDEKNKFVILTIEEFKQLCEWGLEKWNNKLNLNNNLVFPAVQDKHIWEWIKQRNQKKEYAAVAVMLNH